MRLYIDGGEVGSLAVSKSIATSTAPLRIGHFETEWFAGVLDEMRLFSRALSADEVLALAASATAVIDAGFAENMAANGRFSRPPVAILDRADSSDPIADRPSIAHERKRAVPSRSEAVATGCYNCAL